MKVFISWSGPASRQLAEALRWWLPKVIQGVTPFVSTKDIDKGDRWASRLSQELQDTNFGVLCLTPENVTSPWLHYEAGAIVMSAGRLCPVLLGLDKAEVTGPLAQLQLTEVAKDDLSHMLASMNKLAEPHLEEADLRENIDMWWPRLAELVAAVPPPQAPALAIGREPAKPRALPAEMREIMRRFDSAAGPIRKPSVPHRAPTGAEHDLAVELQGLGIPIVRTSAGGSEWTLAAERVPEPLPMAVTTLMLRAARTHGVRVILEANDDRALVADPETGISDITNW